MKSNDRNSPSSEKERVILPIFSSVLRQRSFCKKIAATNKNGDTQSRNIHPNLQLAAVAEKKQVFNQIRDQLRDNPIETPFIIPISLGRGRYLRLTADQTMKLNTGTVINSIIFAHS